METLTGLCLFGALAMRAPTGSAEQPGQGSAAQPAREDLPLPYWLGMRVENLLAKTQEQRKKQLARLASRNDPQAQQGQTLVFSEKDMRSNECLEG